MPTNSKRIPIRDEAESSKRARQNNHSLWVFEAVKTGDMKALEKVEEELSSEKIQLHGSNKEGDRLLHVAVHGNKSKIISFLSNFDKSQWQRGGIDPNTLDRHFIPPLFLAISLNYVNCVSALLEYSSINVNWYCHSRKLSLLDQAIIKENLDIVNLLLEDNRLRISEDGITAYQRAIELGHVGIFNALMAWRRDKKPDQPLMLNLTRPVPSEKQLPMYNALVQWGVDSNKYLLSAGWFGEMSRQSVINASYCVTGEHQEPDDALSTSVMPQSEEPKPSSSFLLSSELSFFARSSLSSPNPFENDENGLANRAEADCSYWQPIIEELSYFKG